MGGGLGRGPHARRRQEAAHRSSGRGGYVNEPADELYDLHADVGETTNVYSQYPEVVKRLQAIAERARWDLGDGGAPGARARAAGFIEDAKTLTSN